MSWKNNLQAKWGITGYNIETQSLWESQFTYTNTESHIRTEYKVQEKKFKENIGLSETDFDRECFLEKHIFKQGQAFCKLSSKVEKIEEQKFSYKKK